MKKKKDLEDIKHTWKCNSLEIEKEMKRIADNIFGYNPKTDPRDPLFPDFVNAYPKIHQ